MRPTPAMALVAVACLWSLSCGNAQSAMDVGSAAATPPVAAEPSVAPAPVTGTVAAATGYLGDWTGDEAYPDTGVTLDPPPEGTNPALSWTEAAAVCAAAFSQCRDATLAIHLAKATTTDGATILPDNSLKLKVDHELAYVLTVPGVPCLPSGPAGATPDQRIYSCFFMSLVDATTGELLGAMDTATAL